jgi:Protein of unknown function (DUF3011)
MNRLDRLYRATSVLLTGCVLASTMPAIAQSGSLTCSSNDGGYRYCRANTQNSVTLTRQISGSPCQQGYSWGYDYRGIWVDRGCRAQFQLGYDNNNNNGGGSNTGAAVAAGILGAIVIGSIIASQNNNDNNDDNHYSYDQQRRDYYRDGYRSGQRDWDDDLDPYYQRYRSRYTQQFQNDFAAGYDDGYNNRPNRYR